MAGEGALREPKIPRAARALTASGAFAWSLGNTLVSRLGTLGIGIVLARILGPEQFGTFAIALVALMAVLSFNELGVSLAIVRWPGDPAVIAPTVNTISVIGSTIFCAVAWLATPSFTALMGDGSATWVVRLLIVSVLVNGAVAAPAALLQRGFEERTRMGIDQANVWVGAICSVVLALAGFGAMALAIGRLLGGIISAIMFLRASPLPYRFGWDKASAGALLKFGLPLAGSSMIVFAIGYADQLATGAMLGSIALGLYVLAFNLSSWPLSIVSQPLRRVAPATFAALAQDRAGLEKFIIALSSIIACATIPAFIALAVAAEPLVRFVYGDAWSQAAPVLSWLVIAALSKVFCELAYDYIVVIGSTTAILRIQGIGLLMLIPSLLAGARFGGLAGVAAAQAAVAFGVMLPLYLWNLRSLGIGPGALSARLWLPVLAGLGLGAAGWMLVASIDNALLGLLAVGGLCLATMAGLIYLRRGDLASLRGISRAKTLEETS
ncbi:oligosaccharide flippase family protein [Glutamicibacter sp.]|uniref:oligosaccharide flippase family protein n=1 Tax=Glutamicibacter sp. TaxID=1931995 RepID=UPI003D6AB079